MNGRPAAVPPRYDSYVRALRPAGLREAMARHDPLESVAAWRCRESLPRGLPRRAGEVGTVILRNGECPYACVMCGYWTDQLASAPAPGAVAAQLGRALERLESGDRIRNPSDSGPVPGFQPPLDLVKLYNGSSLFEPASIPPEDLPAIAERCARYAWVTVESRADLLLARWAEVEGFARGLRGAGGAGARLEVAIGLEAADDKLRAAIGRREPLARFDEAAARLAGAGIELKAFVLLKPPFTAEAAALDLARRGVDHALERGAGTVALIPTMPTPGAMDALAAEGFFSCCDLRTLAAAAARACAAARDRGARVLVEVSELARLPGCPRCREAIADWLAGIDLGEEVPPPWDGHGAAGEACGCEAAWRRLLEEDRVRAWDEYKSRISHDLVRA